jgi:hypothetical protein
MHSDAFRNGVCPRFGICVLGWQALRWTGKGLMYALNCYFSSAVVAYLIFLLWVGKFSF